MTAGSISGSLALTDNNLNVSNATQTISLSGTGTGGTVGTTTNLASSQNPSTYGQSVTITATVAATSGTATPIGIVQFSIDGNAVGSAVTLNSGTATFVTSTLAAGAHSITVTYSPATGSAFITGSAMALSQVVNKATPSVTTWPTASSINYGQTLASSTLSGGQATPVGSFTFTSPTTAPGAGTTSQGVTFTPTDTTDYSTLTGTVSVTVSKATPAVTTWPTASAITYGQTLASSTLSGGASTPAGSFAFTTPTTAPGAGTALQSVTFTPTDLDRLQHVDRHGKRDGEQGHVVRDDMADGQRDHLRPDAGFLDAVRRSLDSGGLVCLHHANNRSGRGHSIAERDLHAHRYDRLQHVDRHGQRNGEQGDSVSDDMADGQLDHLRSDAGFLDAVRRSLDSGGLVRLHHADNFSGRGHSLAERDLHAHRCDRLQHVDRHGKRDGEQGKLLDSIGFVIESLRCRTIR